MDEAEEIFLGAGLGWRALHMNLALHRWERALALASAAPGAPHVATVLYYRRQALRGKAETLPAFRALEGTPVDAAAVLARVRQEEEAAAA